MKIRHLIIGIVWGIFFSSVLFLYPRIIESILVPHFGISDALEQEQKVPQKILFVGDVMLARAVEKRMYAHSFLYPYEGIRDFLASFSSVIGNFEASIPKIHVPTQSMQFAFSVDKSIAKTLMNNGFTHMSLANNHAYDFGLAGYENAKNVLEESGLRVAGSPLKVSLDEVLYVELDDLRIAVVPIYAVVSPPSHAELRETLEALASTSDMQIAYVHWGDEYILTNNTAQKKLAYFLIDSGADAVIGHHPHVVQNISLYKDAPIFYSLGNFIFDQYWEENVKKGLALGLQKEEGGVSYLLYPTYKADVGPSVMEAKEREDFLAELAERSDKALRDGILKGSFVVPLAVPMRPTVE